MVNNYFSLTKPKMIRGNAIIAAAGFLFASQGDINWKLFLAMLVGLAFVIGSGCVINNVIDRDIDAKMNRTKDRAIVRGEVSVFNAIVYGIILSVVGVLVLFFFTNGITTAIAIFGAFAYIALYSPLKHRSYYAALVGTLSGATPILIGYTAVTQHIDLAAILLFLVMVIWQMPHFYAIAIYRLEEYKSANVPVLPVVQGIECTKLHIVIYIPLFLCAVLALTFLGYTGYVFAGIMLILSTIWLILSIQGFKVTENFQWSKKLYKYSLLIILLFAITLSFNTFLI